MSKKNLVLIGFMGSGKTTIGKILAKRLGWTFTDTDDQIEKEQEQSISDIFSEKGEAAFRDIERKCIASLSLKRKQVIATGGGAAKDPVNIQNLKREGIIVYLRLSPMSIYERVIEDETRPLLQPYKGEEKLKRITDLLIERNPMYEGAADIIMDCDGLSPFEITNRILKNHECFL